MLFSRTTATVCSNGCALYSEDAAECTLEELIQRLVNSQATDLQPSDTLPPLFNSAEDLDFSRKTRASSSNGETFISTYWRDLFED